MKNSSKTRYRRAAITWLCMLAAVRALAAGEVDYPSEWNSQWVEEPVLGSTLHLVTAGSGQNPPLVLVHGLGPNGWRDWRPIMEVLQDDYYIVALDLPGFGESSVPRERLSPENFASLIDWLVEAYQFEKIHLAGHSMGGAVALSYAARYPDSVEKLTLIDVAGVLHRAAFVKSMARVEQRSYDFLPDALERKAAQVLNFGDSLVEKINLLPDITQFLRKNDLAWKALLSDQPNTNAALALINTDYSYLAEGVSSPTTIIWGERDPVAPVRAGHLLHGLIENSELHIISDAEHVPLKTHSGTVASLIRNGSPRTQSRAAKTEAPGSGKTDLHCRGKTGARYSGEYRHVVLDGCVNAKLLGVQAQSVELRNSTAEFIDLQVKAQGSALSLDNSTVQLTGARLDGTVALELNGSRIDMAGVYLQASELAIKVDARSVIIASVSESQSPRYRGKLHGLVRAFDTAGEVLPQLQSQAKPLRH